MRVILAIGLFKMTPNLLSIVPLWDGPEPTVLVLKRGGSDIFSFKLCWFLKVLVLKRCWFRKGLVSKGVGFEKVWMSKNVVVIPMLGSVPILCPATSPSKARPPMRRRCTTLRGRRPAV